ncbi:MAG TPA: sigma-70 family RNA polymerase sigma factor [Gemmataceae bacterium]|nr:sigma-70 family RNA polymerase sigma factor [Gemmataceae bacterium]
MDTTSDSLLEQLRHSPDEAAWARFVHLYSPLLFRWARQAGLDEADAGDLVQDVFVILLKELPHFEHDPARSFRAWLKTVTQHAWSDFVEGFRHRAVGQDGRLHTLEARADLAKRLTDEFDHELMEAAMDAVRQRVAPQTWDAFRLTALEGLAGGEAARRLGMPVANLFVARHRVQQMLREEIRRLEPSGGRAGGDEQEEGGNA